MAGVAFRADRKVFQRELAFIAPAAKSSAAHTASIHAATQVRVSGTGDVSLHATDGQYFYESTGVAQGNCVETEFSLRPGLLQQLVPTLPDGDINAGIEDKRFVLTYPDGEFRLLRHGNTVETPKLGEPTGRFEVESGPLTRLLRSARACLPDGYDGQNGGLRFEVEAEGLRVLATEGHILAVLHLDRPPTHIFQPCEFVVSAIACDRILGALRENPSIVLVEPCGRLLLVRAGHRTLIAPQGVLKFPNWRAVMFEQPEIQASFPVSPAKEAVRRLRAAAPSGDVRIRMHIQPGEMTLSVSGATDSIGLSYDGPERDYAFKDELLASVLASLSTERAVFLATSQKQQVMFQSPDEHERFVLMPMWG